MSGLGKSYWAKRLAGRGWLHLDCDAMIAGRLGGLIEHGEGEDPVHAVGRWMGMPWTPGYAERETRYLALEREVTAQALDTLAAQPAGRNVVLDTTGSVIYTGQTLLKRLRDQTCVVYFDTPKDAGPQMVERYLRDPKPVLWQGAFSQGQSESPGQALSRCYPQLLADRLRRYHQLTQVKIDYEQARHPEYTLDAFLACCGSSPPPC